MRGKTIYRTVGEKLADQGRQAAEEWLETADPDDVARIAQHEFKFGRTALVDLQEASPSLPHSLDLDYSWGFWKRVTAEG